MTKNFLFGISLLAVVACNNNQPQTPPQNVAGIDSNHNAQTSLDWNGTYSGITPCADCEGIETSLTLNKDMTYSLSTRYLGKSTEPQVTKGNFSFNAGGNTVTLSNVSNGPSQFFVGENQLFQLDLHGNRITGELAEKYILKKGTMSTDPLANTEWVLIELMGKPLTQKMPNAKPLNLKFNEAGRMSAFVRCNTAGGSYELKEGNRIRFSQLISTMMACDDMELENEYKRVLEQVDNYNLTDSTLVLNRAKMAPLARYRKK